MRGGAGDDLYVLHNGDDVVIEAAGEGVDRIVAFIDHTIEDNVENMIMGAAILAPATRSITASTAMAATTR